MTKSDVLKLLRRLEIAYDESHDSKRADRWGIALADADAGAIEAAADEHLDEEPRWFPKPAQLLARVPPPPRPNRPRTERPRPASRPVRGHIVPNGGGYWLIPEGASVPPALLADLERSHRLRTSMRGEG